MRTITFLLLLFLSVPSIANLTPVTVNKPDKLSLHQKQAIFAQLSAELITKAGEIGYEITLGEAWRSEAMAKIPPHHLVKSVIAKRKSFIKSATKDCPTCRVDTMAEVMYPTKWYADHGKGIADSLHIKRLAIDINLFKNGKYLTKVSDYEPLGLWWEKKSTSQYTLAWGGHFPKLRDAVHFSMEQDGVK